jgi:hypothetical protein
MLSVSVMLALPEYKDAIAVPNLWIALNRILNTLQGSPSSSSVDGATSVSESPAIPRVFN